MTRRAAVAALVAGLVVGLLTGPASAQDAPPRFGEGTHAFRRILFDRQFRPVASPAELGPPDTAVIIIIGETQQLHSLDRALASLGGLRGFVEEGGALLVATDRPSWPELSRNFGVSVTGEVILPDVGRYPPYRDLPECPFVTPLLGADPPLFQPVPLAPGIAPPRVAANLPSRLDLPARLPRGLSLLAVLPVNDRQRRLGGLIPLGSPFAVGGERGAGRVLVLADHSLFINDMMLQPDNGNIDFAYRCAEWLRGPEGSPRERVLYYEDGAIRRDFDIPLKPLPTPPIPPPEAVLPLLNETLHGLEEENQFNRMLVHTFGTEPIYRVLVTAACVAIGAWGFVRLGLFRHRPDIGATTLAKLLARQPAAVPLLEQRAQEQLRGDNVWEAARALARDVFATAPAPGAAPPAIAVTGGWWQRWRWGRLVRRLWQLAARDRPVRVSRRRFAALADDVERLRDALADGTVRILS